MSCIAYGEILGKGRGVGMKESGEDGFQVKPKPLTRIYQLKSES